MTRESMLVTLRADAAKRDEDLRIARKHMNEAAARPNIPENVRAYESAAEWFGVCRDRCKEAHSRLIKFHFEVA